MGKNEFRIILMYPNVMLQNTIPINISLLSACLKKAGFNNIKLFDTTFYKTQEISGDEIRAEFLQLKKWDFSDVNISLIENDMYDDFEKFVLDFKPNLIATTMVENTWYQTFSLLERIKHLDIPTLVGGVNATFAAEEVLSYKCVDMICVGEGEKAIVELCECLMKGTDHTRIKNIWIKKENKIIKNEMRELIDLNELPFLDFSIFEERRFFRPQRGKIVKMFPIETTRGCPYSCAFCCASAWAKLFDNRFLRNKEMKRAIDEIKFQINNYKMESVYFSAETFLAMKKNEFDQFKEMYREINLPFWFQTRPETINEDNLMNLSEFDFSLSIGIESGNEYLRKHLLNRHVTNKKIYEATNVLNRLNVQYSVNNIIGFPGETRQDIFKTIELNRVCKVKDVNCFIFVPYRGTYLHEVCIEKGYIGRDHIAGEHAFKSTLKMPQISSEELYGLFKTFPLYVKLPKKYWDDIKRSESFDTEGKKIYEDLKYIYNESV